ncbi:MAG: flagellar assembly protein FliX [Alphaproteobacteria bacterium]
MKIDGAAPARAPAPRRADRARAGAGGAFASHLQETAGPAVTDAPRPVHATAPLFSLQEVPDAASEARRRAVGRADVLLDRLDDIRHALLLGRLSQRQMEDLSRQIRSARGRVADPALEALLDDIDLRARVELAKLATTA